MFSTASSNRSDQYTLLPTGAASDDFSDRIPSPPRSRSHRITTFIHRFRRPKHRWLSRPVNILFLFVGLLLFAGLSITVIRRRNSTVQWGPDAFAFEDKKPAYLDAPASEPLLIRLAIISRADEFEKRQALREAMLDGIPSAYVQLDYRFFVARATGLTSWITRQRVAREKSRYNDMEVMDSIRDVAGRISEKRFAALKWTGLAPRDQYDYSMTMDSDSFCRFRALAQRLRHVYPDIKPRTDPVLLGSMSVQHVYYINTVPDGNPDDNEEDPHVIGPWYSYPAGIGYLLSSNLTATLLSTDPPLPHHINYPSDDVMIGVWVAGLQYLADPNQQFESWNRDDGLVPPHRVYPKPYLPYTIKTNVVDDKIGWHDLKNRGRAERAVGWDSVCVHHIKPDEMRALRWKEEFRGEWDAKITS